MSREPKYRILTQPTEEPVGIDVFSAHSRMNSGSEDADLLSQYLTAARMDIEQSINRALMPQTWILWLDRFPCESEIRLPMPPLQSVTSVSYFSITDTEIALSSTVDYYADTETSSLGRIVLRYQKYWPTTVLRPANGIRIEFVCGYASAVAVPAPIKQALLLHAAHLYEHREGVLSGSRTPEAVSVPLALGVSSLLSNYQVRYY